MRTRQKPVPQKNDDWTRNQRNNDLKRGELDLHATHDATSFSLIRSSSMVLILIDTNDQ